METSNLPSILETVHEGTSSNSVDDSSLELYAPLNKAVRLGDWKTANEFLQAHPEVVRAIISDNERTGLQIAASLGYLHIVEELVNLMSEQDLEVKSAGDQTALEFAVKSGTVKIAECIIKKNESLLIVPNCWGLIPVTVAVCNDISEMAGYLYSITPFEELLAEQGYLVSTVLVQCFFNKNTLDLAQDLIQRYPSLALMPDNKGDTLLLRLAYAPYKYPSGCQLRFWQRWINDWIQIDLASSTKDIWIKVKELNSRESDGIMSKKPGLLHQLVVSIFNLIGIKRIYDSKVTHVVVRKLLSVACHEIATLTNPSQFMKGRVYDSILEAAKSGIPEFIIAVLRTNSNLLWRVDGNDRGLFFYAVQFRQAKVFSLVYGLPFKDEFTSAVDSDYKNLLHMAAILEPSTHLNRMSGAALQMQRELQWFNEIKHIVQPMMLVSTNNDGMIARELFTESHKILVKDSEKWMKATAISGTVVAALIVTIMFAASFTIPGGNNQNTGYPMFQDHKLFKLFILSESISLFSSMTLVLMFLGILTSRYDEDDFLKSLPTKLIIGLSMLSISIAAVMVTFTAAISLMLPGRVWLVIPVISFASVPISLFVWLQFPLLYEIFISTYGPGIFERNTKRWL